MLGAPCRVVRSGFAGDHPLQHDLDLPVSGTVTAGGAAIDPDRSGGRPARFTYTAPDKDGVVATVRFEVRSKRGADEKAVEITIGPAGWRADGGGSGVTTSDSGTYTVAENDDGTRALLQTSEGCVAGIGDSCRTNTDVIHLYPERG